MFERITSDSLATRALRVLLVFALVFWSSFQVQAVAFGAMFSDEGAGSGHEAGSLVDLSVWQIDPYDSSRISTYVRNAHDTASGRLQSADLSLSTNSGWAQFVAVPSFSDGISVASGDDVAIASFVDWVSSDDSVASVQSSGGVATVTAYSAGSATITCRLNGGANNLVSESFSNEHPGSPCEVSFVIQVSKPYISSIELHKPDGSVCFDNEQIVLSESERASYGFTVRANAFDEATGETSAYECAPGQGLYEMSGGLFGDVTWELLDSNGNAVGSAEGSIDWGTLSLTGTGPYTLRCTVADGLNGMPLSTQVVVETQSAPEEPDEPEDPQGADHHQDALTITIDAPATVAPDDSSTEGEEPSAGDGSDAGSIEQTEEENPSGAPSEGSENSHASEQPALQSGSKTYSLEELQTSLSFVTETYTLSSSHGDITVVGEGPTLAALLDLAGVSVENQLNIESLEFVDYRGVSTTVPWSEIVAVSNPSIMLAARSYVQVDGGASGDEGASTGETNGSTATTLLDNTRFRLLYNGGGAGALADADAFRWTSEIIVHFEGASQPEEPQPEEQYEVFIDYVPVPRGYMADLSPRFNVGMGVTFNYEWERSQDGTDWQVDGESAQNQSMQTKYVMTDDEHIGTYYRFTLINTATGERKVSAPVKIVAADELEDGESNGFIVTLDYIPPIAGDIANFTAHVMVVEGSIDASQVEFIWEMSEDGGASWKNGEDDNIKLLADQSGIACSTLRIPTNPVVQKDDNEASDDAGEGDDEGNPSDSDDADEPGSMIYIRVRAIAPDGRVSVSNAQPLTVHVGDGGADKSSDIEDQVNGGDSQSANQPDDSPNASNEPETQIPSTTPHVQVTPIDNVVMEHSEVSTPTQPNTGAGTSAPALESAPTQIYVNENVTEVVVEQRRAAEEIAVSTTPGARWTQLSTVNPTDDDVRSIMGVNPFAPFAAPLALGITFAGAVEKLIGFRRQMK